MNVTKPVRSALLLVGGLVVLLSGCVGKYKSDFPIVVVNRAINTIQVLANGSEIGQVATGQTGSFSISLAESNSNVFTNGVAPIPSGTVVLSAKDMKTGSLSATKSLTLSQDAPTYVTFSASDFPSVVATVSRFTTSPANPGVNQDVFFNGSSSTVSNGTFAWDFGDGQTGSGVTTTHQYARTGTFTIVLTVTNDNGQTSSSSRTITVSAGLPPNAANFAFTPPVPGINQDVVFAAVNIPTATFAWDFGDGGIGLGATTTHRYTRAATFTVTLRVISDTGQMATSSRTITVSGTLTTGIASFTFSPTAPFVNDTVFFNAVSSTVANATYAWDFGDGTRGSGLTPTHQYSQGATFTVTLVVTNDAGQSATTSKTVPVSAITIAADFTFSPTNPAISLGTNAVIFDASASSAGVTAWTWDFGDGTASASGKTTTHTFTRGGIWVARLTVGDAAGRTATTVKNVTVCTSLSATGACLF